MLGTWGVYLACERAASGSIGGRLVTGPGFAISRRHADRRSGAGKGREEKDDG
jgi:hypothetical protein